MQLIHIPDLVQRWTHEALMSYLNIHPYFLPECWTCQQSQKSAEFDISSHIKHDTKCHQPLVKQFLDVRPLWALRLSDGAAFFQGSRRITEAPAEDVQVSVALVTHLRVGCEEGKELFPPTLSAVPWKRIAFTYRLGWVWWDWGAEGCCRHWMEAESVHRCSPLLFLHLSHPVHLSSWLLLLAEKGREMETRRSWGGSVYHRLRRRTWIFDYSPCHNIKDRSTGVLGYLLWQMSCC